MRQTKNIENNNERNGQNIRRKHDGRWLGPRSTRRLELQDQACKRLRRGKEAYEKEFGDQIITYERFFNWWVKLNDFGKYHK
ncbi:MAG: hypothetical protein K6F33_02175 [Bacteroidales bacterium]|nr:hypothetical protein [Bacteroidales bacterium]